LGLLLRPLPNCTRARFAEATPARQPCGRRAPLARSGQHAGVSETGVEQQRVTERHAGHLGANGASLAMRAASTSLSARQRGARPVVAVKQHVDRAPQFVDRCGRAGVVRAA
jgi:hypothetical protein